jgi:hypothetical protein
MKKFATIFFGIFISFGFTDGSKKKVKEQSKSFSIIFIASETYGNEILPVAVPIVIYKNGKYIQPPECVKNENGKFNNIECNNYNRLILPFIRKGATLFELNNGVQNSTFAVLKTSITGMGREIHCGVLNAKPSHTLLTNNPNIGILPLTTLDVTDRPILIKRKDCIDYGSATGGNMYCKDKLLTKVDIDGDGFPELIYENEVTEGYYYTIYSKKNNRWIKVFEGSGDGV